jgi:hypothetical protein
LSKYNLKESHKKEVTAFVNGGQEAITSLFLNKDGTYQKDAVDKFFYLKYGREMVASERLKIQRAAESKANEDIVTRGNDKQQLENNADLTDKKRVEEQVEAITKRAGIPVAKQSIF